MVTGAVAGFVLCGIYQRLPLKTRSEWERLFPLHHGEVGVMMVIGGLAARVIGKRDLGTRLAEGGALAGLLGRQDLGAILAGSGAVASLFGKLDPDTALGLGAALAWDDRHDLDLWFRG